ncbi:VOC family protein [Terasakiella sp. A23]|uniref:VOC family protein n=1 Tax=Terasakiella sp. FCG-A23 TaxID=3080561 RepID=UPI00295307EF|nr:VOC family protein [Terasakiella sp. A23]MDV7339878.1 VOC family protein [Terasakiella sp. A23]
MTKLEICHLFVFVNNPEAIEQKMTALGFTESYRRKHPGQGTENICYCFDNCYLEVLWVNNLTETRSDAVAPLQFDQRGFGKGNPFGIAIRDNQPFPFDHHLYHAPYFPDDFSLPYAKSSDDLTQPFLFLSPGSKRPDVWAKDKKVPLQSSFSEINKISVSGPALHGDYLKTDFQLKSSNHYQMDLTLTDKKGKDVAILSLPDFILSKI